MDDFSLFDDALDLDGPTPPGPPAERVWDAEALDQAFGPIPEMSLRQAPERAVPNQIDELARNSRSAYDLSSSGPSAAALRERSIALGVDSMTFEQLNQPAGLLALKIQRAADIAEKVQGPRASAPSQEDVEATESETSRAIREMPLDQFLKLAQLAKQGASTTMAFESPEATAMYRRLSTPPTEE